MLEYKQTKEVKEATSPQVYSGYDLTFDMEVQLLVESRENKKFLEQFEVQSQ